MPFLASKYRRRYRSARRRRNNIVRRRRLYRSNRGRRLGLKLHHFKRTYVGSDISGGTTITSGALSFALNSLPGYTEFTNLFDCYRINKIVVKFVPAVTSAEVGATSTNPMTNFFTVLDFNDATALSTLNDAFEYGNLKMTRGYKTHTRVFTPSTLLLGSDSSDRAAMPKYKQWITTAEADILHYGCKYVAETQATAADIVWKTYVTMYFSCKSVK